MVTTVSADSAAQRTWLVFRLGPYVMCASALDVEGIIQPPQRIAKIPLTPDYVLGAFFFRGRSAAAISLRCKLKLGEGQDRATSPFIVARIGGALVGFWVDEVKDVIQESDAEWRPMPAMPGTELFARFGIRGSELMLQTSFAALREAKGDVASVATRVAAQADLGRPIAAVAVLNVDVVTASLRSENSECVERSDVTQSVAATSVGSSNAAEQIASRVPPATERVVATVATTRASRRPNTPSSIFAARRATPGAARDAVSSVAMPAPLPEPQPSRPVSSVSRRDFSWAPIGIAAGLAVSLVALVFAALQLRFTAASAPPVLAASPVTAIDREFAPPTSTPMARAIATKSVRQEPIVMTVERPTERPTAPASRGHTHVVVAGDTLWNIAKKQVGDPFRYPELAKLSDIENPDLIHPGDIVRIEIREPRP